MNILMLTQWFEPEPVFKGLSFAKELAAKGHNVQVLTGFPNYPDGRLYPGYRLEHYAIEHMDGIPVVRVPLYPSHDQSAIRRATNYFSFAISASLVRKSLLHKPDVLYVYHPPPTIGFAAITLKKRLGVPMVYDIQDMWPDSLVATKMLSNSLFLRLIDKWCRLVYASADRIVVLSPGFKKLLIARGVPSERVDVIYNWCEEQMLGPQPSNNVLKRELGLEGRFNILFAGNMGPAQALESVLQAAEMLKTRLPQVQFVFIGGGVSVASLQHKATEMGLNNVRFLSRRPMNQIAAILNLADALLVHLRREHLFEITIPSKTQAYMAMGKPIIMGVAGDAAELVRQADAGFSCEPETPTSIANTVFKLHGLSKKQRDQMGQQGRAFYKCNMSLKKGGGSFDKIFQDLIV